MKAKLLYCSLLSAALTVGVSRADDNDKTLGQKTADALENAKDKTVEAGQAVVDDTKKAATAVANETKKVATDVKDAVTPDARKVEVTLTGRRIEMPQDLPPGMTAFVVHNNGKTKHNFKIEGEGVDKDFLFSVDPGDTKTLHVDLKSGEYKVFIPGKNGEERHNEVSLRVK